MGILDLARADAKRITTDLNGFAVLMTFKTPTSGSFDYSFDFSFNSSQMFTLTGLHTKHHQGINGETGQRINTKTASVTVDENKFNDVGYPVRNANREVDLRDHQVAVKDSTGVVCTYVVREWFPDEALGIIVCILGDFE